MDRGPWNSVAFGIAAALVGVVALASRRAPQAALSEGRLLDEKMHHLGDDKTPEWAEASADPEPQPLTLDFDATPNASEWLLELSARHVDNLWSIELNGAELATLKKLGGDIALQRFAIPAGRMRAGKNTLTIRCKDSDKAQPGDDLTVGRIRLHEKSQRELFHLGRVDVTVTDAANGQPLPARVTVADEKGNLPDLWYAEAPHRAVRKGIAYTSDGVAAIELPEGRWQIWASRGMEWSAAHQDVEVRAGAASKVALSITHEVDTTGWLACDTHIHTVTFSGHGDASIDERMATIAGEGIEVPIATDHNKQIDYRPFQQKQALEPWFTPITGNEVTTDNGHMNAFPLPPGTDVPPSKESNWEKLVAGIRAKGAEIVILNHPRWPENGKDPLTKFGFDEATGARANGEKFTFDCLELVNSDCPTGPPSVTLPVWYALLNRGERFTGVGASDSHHVGVIVGQGRTYVPSKSDDPTQLDVADLCRQFKQGHVSVSLGLFATIELAGAGLGDSIAGGRMGDTVAIGSDRVDVTVRVRHPSWVTPTRVDLVVGGTVAATADLSPQPGDAACDCSRTLRLPLPAGNCWVVAVATGARVTAPFWAMQLPEAIAITNPVFVTRGK